MKTIIYFLFLLFSVFINAQTTPVPDSVFENKLISLGIDTNGLTGNILNTDAEGVVNLNVTNSAISDLTGIEAFVDLEILDCDTNLLTGLDLTFNTKLRIVDCQKNELTSLDIASNLSLVSLACQENKLATLDTSNNVLLNDLSCQKNSLTELNLIHNTELYQIICHDNLLTSITLPNTQDKLEIVWCYNNLLEHMDLTNAPRLATLRFENNKLNYLDLRNGNNTSIHTMDARNNSSLELICVDDIGYSESAFNWNKDATAQYSETCTLSIGDLDVPKVKVHPNPVIDVLIINMDNNLLKAVQVYNHLGQLVSIETETVIEVYNYTSGIYVLRLETIHGKILLKKIVKI